MSVIDVEDRKASLRGVPVADCRVLSDEELDQVGGGPLFVAPIVVAIGKGAATIGAAYGVGYGIGRTYIRVKEELDNWLSDE